MYNFGVPGPLIWSFHILIGLYLTFLGYRLLNQKSPHQVEAIGLIVTGVLALLYHGHLWAVSK